MLALWVFVCFFTLRCTDADFPALVVAGHRLDSCAKLYKANVFSFVPMPKRIKPLLFQVFLRGRYKTNAFSHIPMANLKQAMLVHAFLRQALYNAYFFVSYCKTMQHQCKTMQNTNAFSHWNLCHTR